MELLLIATELQFLKLNGSYIKFNLNFLNKKHLLLDISQILFKDDFCYSLQKKSIAVDKEVTLFKNIALN